MKRSELVKRVKQMLISCLTDDIQPLSVIADNAVYLCEDAGMLPPKHTNKSAINFSVFEAEYSGTPLESYSWELE